MELIYDFKIENYLTGEKDKESVKTPFFFPKLNYFYGEEAFVKNYSNVNSECRFEKSSVKVLLSSEKVSIRFYNYTNYRPIECQYFKKNMFFRFITYDYKKHILYCGNSNKKGKKVYSYLTKNSWYSKPITSINKLINQYMKPNGDTFVEVDEKTQRVKESFELFFNSIPNIDNSITNPDMKLYKHYLDGLKVKLPNNWMVFTPQYPQLTKKIFKKNKFKFIDSYMSLYGLTGSKIKRILHTIKSDSGIYNLMNSLKIFGNDFILSQTDDVIKNIIESRTISEIQTLPYNYELYKNSQYTKRELNNCFEIFKLMINGEVSYHTFFDHIWFKVKLTNLNPVVWKSKTYDDFNNEHFIWSEKISEFNDPKYKRIYNLKTINIIEEPMDNYYPFILKTYEHYVMESLIQNNCVRTYNNRPESIIISLRKDDINNNERASIEYKISGNENNIKLTRVQSLGKHNKKLDDSWLPYLETLDKRVDYLLDKNLFNLPKYIVEYNSNKYSGNIIFDFEKDYLLTPGQRGIEISKVVRFDDNNKNLYTPVLEVINDTPF